MRVAEIEILESDAEHQLDEARLARIAVAKLDLGAVQEAAEPRFLARHAVGHPEGLGPACLKKARHGRVDDRMGQGVSAQRGPARIALRRQ
jgi:hypothetical protein